jgi:hypothetical protein
MSHPAFAGHAALPGRLILDNVPAIDVACGTAGGRNNNKEFGRET